jgi:hypothetical protein
MKAAPGEFSGVVFGLQTWSVELVPTAIQV